MGPGPSNPDPRVLAAMTANPVGHLDPYFVELMDQIIPGADKDIVTPLFKRISKHYAAIHLKAKVTKVEKVNDYEVLWTLKEPYFEVLNLAAGIAVLPKHFYEKFTPGK